MRQMRRAGLVPGGVTLLGECSAVGAHAAR